MMQQFKIVWVVLLFLFTTLVFSQEGYNGCYGDEWMYHGHSHTCIRYFRYAATWADASAFCKDQVSSGLLVKIDDEITDTFIQEMLLPKQHWSWMGLYALENDSNRWDGFPNEVPQFEGTINNQAGFTTKGFFITRGFWGRSDRDWKHCICQHDPFIPQTQIKCPPPTRENTNATTPIECQYYFNHWNSLTMTGPDGRASNCTNGQTCVGQLDGLTITETKGQNGHFLAQYNGQMTRHQEGNWSCSINLPSIRISTDESRFWNDLNLKDSKSCQLQIYEPASPLSCKQTLLPNSLTVVCLTDRIYPQASCLWKYSQNSSAFQTLDAKLTTDTHTSYTDDQNGFTYFRSECQLKLTKDDFTFTPGALVVQVAMIPSIDGVDMSSNQDAIRTVNHPVVIDTPSKPALLLSGKSILSNAVVFLWNDEEVKLTCQVSSYSPPVQTTVLSCEFPITQSGVDVNRMSKDGSSVVSMTQTATRLMDGKNCTCWGEHITGRSEIGTVIFNIGVPAKVLTFSHNASSDGVVDQASQVSMWCDGEGVPSPSVAISKHPSQGDIHVVLKPSSNTARHNVSYDFQARCSDSGQYVCQVTTTLIDQSQITTTLIDQSQTRQDSSELSIRVKCPPTICDGYESRAFAKPGGNTTITVCAFAYPLPDVSKFELQMRTGNQQWIGLNGSSVTIGNYSNFMNNITVTIQDIQPSQFGAYRLYYPTDDGTTPQHISFQLDRLAIPDDDDDASTIPIIVAIVISVIVIVVVIVIVLIFMKRRGTLSKIFNRFNKPGSPSEKRKTTQEKNESLNNPGFDSTEMTSAGNTNPVDDIYAQVDKSAKSRDASKKTSQQSKSKALAYVQVDFSNDGKLAIKDESADAKHKQGSEGISSNAIPTSSGDTLASDESVEYAGIDVVATVRMKDMLNEKAKESAKNPGTDQNEDGRNGCEYANV